MSAPFNNSKHQSKTNSGTQITAQYIDKLLNEEAGKIKNVDKGQLETARKYMSSQVRSITHS
jgi:hypothetical protein